MRLPHDRMTRGVHHVGRAHAMCIFIRPYLVQADAATPVHPHDIVRETSTSMAQLVQGWNAQVPGYRLCCHMSRLGRNARSSDQARDSNGTQPVPKQSKSS
eukprot:1374825-Amphidinium_carterae.2